MLQDPIKHERFLMNKFVEFMSHPFLKPLLQLSAAGETVRFVECFNSLGETECPMYSRYKVSLYDCNQRKFVVQVHQPCLTADNLSGQQQINTCEESKTSSTAAVVFQ